MTLQQDVSKVSLITWDVFLHYQNRFYSESNGVIFKFVHQRSHKLWSYNQIRVIQSHV